MKDFNDFKLLYAEAMHYCQMLEWNLKQLYVVFYKNAGSRDDQNAICFETSKIKFAEAFNNLRLKDKKFQVLPEEIYKRIKTFMGGRDYLAHDAFNKIVYGNKNFEKTKDFQKQCKNLQVLKDKIRKLAFFTEKRFYQ